LSFKLLLYVKFSSFSLSSSPIIAMQLEICLINYWTARTGHLLA